MDKATVLGNLTRIRQAVIADQSKGYFNSMVLIQESTTCAQLTKMKRRRRWRRRTGTRSTVMKKMVEAILSTFDGGEEFDGTEDADEDDANRDNNAEFAESLENAILQLVNGVMED